MVHVRLNCPLKKSLLLPSNSRTQPKNGYKLPKFAMFVSHGPKTKNGPYRGLRGSKTNSEGTQSTCNPPLFVVSKPQKPPTSHLDLRTSGHLVEPEGNGPARGGGQQWVHQGPQGKTIIFSKVVPRPLAMLKQVLLAHFEPVVMRSGPWKLPKCLENGSCWEQKWVKNGSKMHFSKSHLRPFGMLKQVFLAHFERMVTRFGPWIIPKCLENWAFWDQKWVKNGSKMHFSKNDPRPFGMLKQVFLAHFERVVMRSGAWTIPKSLENGPLWDQKWVKNGSKTCFFQNVVLDHLGCTNKCLEPILSPLCPSLDPAATCMHQVVPFALTSEPYGGATESWGEGFRLDDIYYYTPLPLNLANKQQASKGALLLSVSAIARPHRSGLYSTLAILEPRWWRCQIQVLSQKVTGGSPGRGRQVGRCPPRTVHFMPQNSLFWPKMALKPRRNGQTKANRRYTPHAA